MKRTDVKIAVFLAGLVALLFAAWTGPARSESRARGLQKVLEKAGFSAEDRGQIERTGRAALQAGIAERDVSSLVESCAEGGFQAAQILRVLSLATQLTLEHLPVESFEAKISEGIAKRVAPDKVLQVAERRALMLNRAKALLNNVLLEGAPVSAREDLIADVAAAIEAGRAEEDLRRLLAAAFRDGAGVSEIRQKLFP